MIRETTALMEKVNWTFNILIYYIYIYTLQEVEDWIVEVILYYLFSLS